MSATAAARPEKSTTVRSRRAKLPPSLQLLRWSVQALAQLAPAMAEERVAELFFHPRRGKVRVPSVVGFEARPFTVFSEGERLACWSFGEGPAVLAVHGWEGDAAQMAKFVPPLVAAGRRVVLFDQPAHGSSTGKRTHILSMSRAVQAVAEVTGPIEGLVAHSLGGTATAVALARGLRVGRAAFLASPVEPHDFARQLREVSGLGPEHDEGVLRRVCARIGMTPEEVPVDTMVRELEVPLLVLHDPEDLEVPIRHAERYLAAWPGAEVVRVPEVGHRKILRDPAVVARVVAHVLAGGGRAEERLFPHG